MHGGSTAFLRGRWKNLRDHFGPLKHFKRKSDIAKNYFDIHFGWAWRQAGEKHEQSAKSHSKRGAGHSGAWGAISACRGSPFFCRQNKAIFRLCQPQYSKQQWLRRRGHKRPGSTGLRTAEPREWLINKCLPVVLWRFFCAGQDWLSNWVVSPNKPPWVLSGSRCGLSA